jgi:hypothetical protein
MAKVKILARHLSPELNTGTVALPVWTPIGGLTSLTFGTDKTDSDDTDFDSDGWAEHKVVQRAASISFEGFYKEDPTTGDRDAGQEALLALADAVGYDSLKPLRVTTPGGNVTTYQVSARVDGPAGGGINDNAGFNGELTVSGKPVFTPAP